MQFKKCAVFGVLITLYLSTDSWCHYIPEKKTNPAGRKNGTSPHSPQSSPSEHIQICGNALTTFIIEACDRIVSSFSQANASKESVQTKIAEDCCDKKCPLDYLQSYCGETQLFTLKNILRGKLLNNLTRNQATDSRINERPPYKGTNKGMTEVRVREKKNGKRKWGKSKKKKRSFKRKCAYKSFGHYLLKLERGERVRDNMAKKKNSVSKIWPSIQIGTISPEMEKFGGQPIVVMKKNKSNSV